MSQPPSAPSPPRSRMASNLALVSASVLVALALLEGIARVLFSDPHVQAKHPDLAVEVINLGEPGINTEREVQIAAAHASVQPDVVILGYVLNDAFHEAQIDVMRHKADDFIMVRPGQLGDSAASLWFKR